MIRIKVKIAWRSKLQVSSSHVRFQVVLNGFWAPWFWLLLRIAACVWTISICHSWKSYGLRFANLYIIKWESCYFFMAKNWPPSDKCPSLEILWLSGTSFICTSVLFSFGIYTNLSKKIKNKKFWWQKPENSDDKWGSEFSQSWNHI